MKGSQLSAITLAAAGALTLLAAPSFAQTYDDDKGAYGDEIIVTAPYVHREVTGRDASGAQIETLTAQRAVETADLDLRDNRDGGELHRRIRDTATDECVQIENSADGVSLDSRRQCIRDAERDAMAQADVLVDTARG